jgi:hypothetical protein
VKNPPYPETNLQPPEADVSHLWMADDPLPLRKFFEFLQQKCARTGSCSLTREAISKEIERSRVTVSKYSAILRKRGLITVFEGRHTNVYTVLGLRAAFPNEPPAFSNEAKLLAFLRARCRRTGNCSLFHAEIGKAIGWNWHVVKRTSAKLEKNGLIIVKYHQGRHGNIYAVPGGKPTALHQPTDNAKTSDL